MSGLDYQCSLVAGWWIYPYDLLRCPSSGISVCSLSRSTPHIVFIMRVTLKLRLPSTLSLLSRLGIYSTKANPLHPHVSSQQPPPSHPSSTTPLPPQADPYIQNTQQLILRGRLIKAIVLMYVALRRGYCVPMDNVLPSCVPIVPFEMELGKYPIYRPLNNNLMFLYKC